MKIHTYRINDSLENEIKKETENKEIKGDFDVLIYNSDYVRLSDLVKVFNNENKALLIDSKGKSSSHIINEIKNRTYS